MAEPRAIDGETHDNHCISIREQGENPIKSSRFNLNIIAHTANTEYGICADLQSENQNSYFKCGTPDNLLTGSKINMKTTNSRRNKPRKIDLKLLNAESFAQVNLY
jgi:hypothetical protein